jgi:two-component system OmpR family sensor kinase
MQGEFEIALRSPRSPERYQEVLRSGLEEIQRMSTMCDELLLINQADSGTLPLHRARTDVNQLVRESAQAVQHRAEAKNLRVTTPLDYSGQPVLVDPELIGRVLDELIDNAVKFTPTGGAIEIGSGFSAEAAHVWVADSGPGVPAGQISHLFEPFYRADPARTRDEGTGLGLCMAASVTRLHRGTITAMNLRGGGARFDLALPFA